MEPTNEKFVLFIDLLGFAALTESYPIDAEAIRLLDRPGAWGLDRFLNHKHNPLTHAVETFHRTIKWAVTIAELSHSLTAIIIKIRPLTLKESNLSHISTGNYLHKYRRHYEDDKRQSLMIGLQPEHGTAGQFVIRQGDAKTRFSS